MRVINVTWTPEVNVLTVECDCKNIIYWPTNISLIQCPNCHNKEWWHSDGVYFDKKYKIAKIELK